MDLLDLKIFKQLYMQRNITAVSKSLYLSQPTISYRLKKLQEELNVHLYDYDGRYHFNEKSRLFFDYCNKVLNDYDTTLNHMREDTIYPVSLSTVATSLYQLPVFEACLKLKLFPHIISCNSEDALVNIMEKRSRFAIVGGIHQDLPPEIRSLSLKDQKIFFVYNRACNGNLSDTPVILDQYNSGIRRLIEDFLRGRAGLKIAGELGLGIDRLKIIQAHPVGMFLHETYLNNLSMYPDIRVSKDIFIMQNIRMVLREKEYANAVTRQIIEQLNKIH